MAASPSCVTFGGEAVGYKCRLDYDWQVGHAYRFDARSLGNDWWRGTVTDDTTGAVTTIGDIQVPAGSGLARSSVLFDEVYRGGASCDALAPATITFANLTGDGTRPTWTGTTTPAPCARAAVLEATGDVTTISTGQVAARSLGSLEGFALRGTEVRRGDDECLDAEGGATTAGTRVIAWACHGGANQQWVQRRTALQLAGTDPVRRVGAGRARARAVQRRVPYVAQDPAGVTGYSAKPIAIAIAMASAASRNSARIIRSRCIWRAWSYAGIALAEPMRSTIGDVPEANRGRGWSSDSLDGRGIAMPGSVVARMRGYWKSSGSVVARSGGAAGIAITGA